MTMQHPVPDSDPAPYLDDGFAPYYKANVRWVAARAMLLTGNQADAEDITQEGFAAIYRKWADARDWNAARRDGYVRQVLRNLAADLVRGQIRQRQVRVRLASGPEHAVCFEDGVLDRLIALSPEVRAVLELLSPAERVVLVLSEVEELTDGEIAGMLGITTSTVRTHRQRARERLLRHCRGTPPDKGGRTRR